MADSADVEAAFVDLIAGVLYPIGTAQPISPLTGCIVQISRGWPLPPTLDAALLAGNAMVTVFADPGMTRNTSRYWPLSDQTAVIPPTVTASVAGALVTLAGTITAGNVVAVQTGTPPQAYATIVAGGDTLPTLAARLAAKIPGASAAGAVITMPTPLNLIARSMTPQPVATETRRQDQGFRVSVWCANPTQRDLTAGLIDGAIAGLRDAFGNLTRFLTIKAREVAWVRYLRGYIDDKPGRDALWRRDLVYQVEYSTTLLESDPAMMFAGGALNTGTYGALPPAP